MNVDVLFIDSDNGLSTITGLDWWTLTGGLDYWTQI